MGHPAYRVAGPVTDRACARRVRSLAPGEVTPAYKRRRRRTGDAACRCEAGQPQPLQGARISSVAGGDEESSWMVSADDGHRTRRRRGGFDAVKPKKQSGDDWVR